MFNTAGQHQPGALANVTQNLLVFPPLFHAALLALLSGAVPLKGIATSVIVALPSDDSGSEAISDPSPLQANEASSLHLLGFTTQGTLLLAESEGNFTDMGWMSAVDVGRKLCNDQMQAEAGDATDDEERQPGMARVLRSITEAKVAAEANWR